MRLLGRALGHAGSEGPVELAKLEALHAALRARPRADSPLRRTLAGAMVSCERGLVVVERAPPRRKAGDKASGRRISALTKSEHGARPDRPGWVKMKGNRPIPIAPRRPYIRSGTDGARCPSIIHFTYRLKSRTGAEDTG